MTTETSITMTLNGTRLSCYFMFVKGNKEES